MHRYKGFDSTDPEDKKYHSWMTSDSAKDYVFNWKMITTNYKL